jgi:opacity protein-like surface antigen
MEWHYYVLATLSIFATNGFAVEQKSSPFSWVAAFSAGPVWENDGETQTFYLAPDIEKTYKANNETNALGDGELFIGFQHELTKTLQGQLGLTLAATTAASLSGYIWDDASPEFNNFEYNYQIQHTHLAAKGKLLIDRGYWVIPWVSVSLGVAFNHAYDFDSTPLIFEAIPLPDFSSNTTTSFTYTLSVGIQRMLDQHWQLGVGYEFADWGQSELGRAPGQTLNSGLKLDHFYTNGILFNLTYL